LSSAAGIWSQIKRAPTAVKKRITFEVPGPAVVGAPPLDSRARQIFGYFKKYNYQVKETGEVITFEGVYAADRGQAAAVTFYTFAGEFDWHLLKLYTDYSMMLINKQVSH
jgi:hypothetical protein